MIFGKVTQPHINTQLIHHITRAQTHFKQGRHRAALEAWGQVLNPRYTDRETQVISGSMLGTALLGQARALTALKRWEEACDAFESQLMLSAMEIMPAADQLTFHSDHATALMGCGRWQQAAEAIHQAADIAAYDLDKPGLAAALFDRLVADSAAAGEWSVAESEAREAMTFAKMAGLTSLSFRAGWKRVEALRALGRGGQARAQALALLTPPQQDTH